MPATISASGASASAPLGSSSSVDRATASTVPRSAARAASLPHPSSIAVARAATIADARATAFAASFSFATTTALATTFPITADATATAFTVAANAALADATTVAVAIHAPLADATTIALAAHTFAAGLWRGQVSRNRRGLRCRCSGGRRPCRLSVCVTLWWVPSIATTATAQASADSVNFPSWCTLGITHVLPACRGYSVATLNSPPDSSAANVAPSGVRAVL